MSKIFHKSKNQDNEEYQDYHGSRGVSLEANEVIQTKTINSKAINHINSYPLVQQTFSGLEQIAINKIIYANTKPIILSISNSKPVKLIEPVTRLTDNIFDKSLTLAEIAVPSLKTKTYERLYQELMTPCNFVVKTANGSINITNQYVITPTHNQILNFRKYYNEHFYNTNGAPIIRGTLDPLVRPCNSGYEKLIVKILPNGKQVPTDGYSNQLDRTFALTVNLVQRTIPVIKTQTKGVVTLPFKYVYHVNNIFNENLDKQENLKLGNCYSASKNSIKQLNKETIDYLKSSSPKLSLPCFRKKNNQMQIPIATA